MKKSCENDGNKLQKSTKRTGHCQQQLHCQEAKGQEAKKMMLGETKWDYIHVKR